MKIWGMKVWAGALVLASGLFAALPQVDLAVSGWFFDGRGFAVQDNAGIEAIRRALRWSENAAGTLAVVMTLVVGLTGTRMLLPLRDWFLAACVFVLGPGLLVNVVLKQVWGRARPYMVTEFGGPSQFSGAWVVSDQCQSNCSFTSGEAAGAVALAILLALLARAQGAVWLRGALWTMAVAVPVFTFWQRIAAGRHFLSDVVLSALMVALIAAVLVRLLAPRQPRASAVDIRHPTP